MTKPAAGLKANRVGPQEGYRPCVGLMLIERGGRLFVGERRGPLLDAWQMPQGGIDPGESPIVAARRELREEIGTDRAELLRESRYWYAYDLPPELLPGHWDPRYHGQSQRWFAFQFTGRDADIDLASHQPEFERWRWATAEEVLRLIVPFKRPVYEAVLREFADLLR